MADTDAPRERFLVTMTSAFALPDGGTATHQATDHVATEDLDAYLAAARQNWQVVTVADQPDTITTAYDPSVIPDTPSEE